MIKVFINGTDVTIKKPIFGGALKYDTCEVADSQKKFLNIWNVGGFFFGKLDLWDSKDGDILSLEKKDKNNELVEKKIFEFKDERFWLMKDYKEEESIVDFYFKKHPDVLDVKIRDNQLVVNNYTAIEVYKIVKKSGFYEFKLLKTEVLDLEEKDDEIIEVSDSEINTEFEKSDLYCNLKSKCVYRNKKRECSYFDKQLTGELLDEEPTCEAPFYYLNQD